MFSENCFLEVSYIENCWISSVTILLISNFAIPWTVACQAPLSVGFFQARILGRWPFPPPGDLPDPGIEPMSPALQADSLPLELSGKSNNMSSSLQSGRWVASSALRWPPTPTPLPLSPCPSLLVFLSLNFIRRFLLTTEQSVSYFPNATWFK